MKKTNELRLMTRTAAVASLLIIGAFAVPAASQPQTPQAQGRRNIQAQQQQNPVLSAYQRAVQPFLPADARSRLQAIDTSGVERGAYRQLAFIAADRAVRQFAPAALDAAGRPFEAGELRQISTFSDEAGADRALDKIGSVINTIRAVQRPDRKLNAAIVSLNAARESLTHAKQIGAATEMSTETGARTQGQVGVGAQGQAGVGTQQGQAGVGTQQGQAGMGTQQSPAGAQGQADLDRPAGAAFGANDRQASLHAQRAVRASARSAQQSIRAGADANHVADLVVQSFTDMVAAARNPSDEANLLGQDAEQRRSNMQEPRGQQTTPRTNQGMQGQQQQPQQQQRGTQGQTQQPRSGQPDQGQTRSPQGGQSSQPRY